ncbi:MAG: conjugative transposon protein TraJ [Flavobacterium sp. 38-13]|uniref:conjugative transposon protein TraJ n=1 Tax=Flavobacterium sp. 38-13 TaxID=1896168 RepID=UPI00096089FA|nr:conjugative transposon protein TraJ [Flavobacterium sp. 38-13]OJX54835.1 MAG: conjugative transposon protein TraJ [Flavobacterium sp. 38-13]
MKTTKKIALAMLMLLLPILGRAQGLADEMNGLHGVLDQLYNEMMPLCSQLIGVGQGLAGFAALWYIASRVWRHLANAEPIDFYPLMRPFAIGLCILLFPSVMAIINGVMKPPVTGTAKMVEGSNKAIAVLLKKKEEAIKTTNAWQMYVGESGSGDRDRWYKYTHDNASPDDEGMFEGIGNDIKFAMSKLSYNFRNSVKEWMSEVLRILFEAAALCIDTLRTFQLVVLSILGPLVFGLAVFDGFQHTLTVWLARYINIFLWLPVANIFGSIIGKIQEKMLAYDISQINATGDTFFSRTDAAYLVFMIIGIVGYFTVPSVANYIVHAGGGGALGQKITGMFGRSTQTVVSSTTAGVGMAADAMGKVAGQMSQSMAANGNSAPYFDDGNGKPAGYQNERLKGNS